MDDWRETRVGDLVRDGVLLVSDGYRMRNDELGISGVPFVRGGDIGEGWINTATVDHIRPEFEKKISPKLSRPGDAAFITKGTVGRAGWLRPGQRPVVFAPQVAWWRSLDQNALDSRFVFYLIKSPSFQAALDAVKTHGAMAADYVSISQQHDFRLRLPKIEAQRAVSYVLGALDDKIDLNRRMNDTLKAMARALFQDWFVDFGPVRARIEGREPYLRPGTCQIFPSRMHDDVPEGWRHENLISISAELRRGISPSYTEDGGVSVLNQKCVRDHAITRKHARRHDRNKRSVDSRLVQVGDVLVNSTGVGTLGRVAQVWSLPEPTIVDSHVTIVRANREHVTPLYLGLLLTGREEEIEALGEGSTGQTELGRARLGSLQVLVPSAPVLDAFEEIVGPLVERSEQNDAESETLANLRDILLPKLISGDLRVRDAERLVGEAA